MQSATDFLTRAVTQVFAMTLPPASIYMGEQGKEDV